jgi:hypothetical protein
MKSKLIVIVILILVAVITIPFIIGSMHREKVQKILNQGDELLSAGKYSEAFEVYLRAKTIDVNETFSTVIKKKLKALIEMG